MFDLSPLVPELERDNDNLGPGIPPNEEVFSQYLFSSPDQPNLPFAWILLVHFRNSNRQSLVLGQPRKDHHEHGEPSPTVSSKPVVVETNSLHRTASVCLVFLRRLFNRSIY